jgi:hypothetical protein
VVRLIEPSTEQKAAHGEFIAKMKDPVWLKE